MKKYHSLSELIIEYREFKNITQQDLSVLLNVDTRTISRWEKGDSRIHPDKVDDVVEALFLPHQVLQNLNSEQPIAIFYDLESRTYSFSLIGTNIADAELFRAEMPVEEERIHVLSADEDVEFINGIQALRTDNNPLDAKLIKSAAEFLPELNLVLFDQAGFYAGHVSFLPLKNESYEKIKVKHMRESELTLDDLEMQESEEVKVFYFYSLYADSISHAYYLMNRVLEHFKKNHFKNYIVAGTAYHEIGVNVHREMGLKAIWEEKQDIPANPIRVLMEGNYDMYLFGKMT
jgi:transcriptional regulator with XRE-family HTH domain